MELLICNLKISSILVNQRPAVVGIEKWDEQVSRRRSRLFPMNKPAQHLIAEG
jgi:hypothetical protein